MKVEIRGIVQWHDKGHKKTKIVFRRDDQHGRRSLLLPDDTVIDKDVVVENLGRFTKSRLGNILIPKHIRIRDIKEHDQK